VRKLLAAGFLAAALALPAVAVARPGDGAVRTDHDGARDFVGGLGLSPPPLYPDRVPPPFGNSRVLAYDQQALGDDSVDYLVQWVHRTRGSSLALTRVPCSEVRRGLRRLPAGEFRRRVTTVRSTDGVWVVDDLATVLAWCEHGIGYGVAFIGPTDDWRLERRKVRAVVRALEPLT
jgi:hypothetical protein